MRNYLLLLFFLIPIISAAQIVRSVTIGDQTIDVYRLDKNQKNKLVTTIYTKDKKKNIQLINELTASYTNLEQNLNLLSNNIDLYNDEIMKEISDSWKLIDFRLGSDAPNYKQLLTEYRTITSYYWSIKERKARKKAIENEISKSK
ncbi:hypothetical protein [Dysgonomonas sp. ZJ279]|uniref:hypothetical protein n=1 Tax=Dysgonomonas sp. ZJ279 TaxID=2709796 RepID=UPI0013EC066E|nr:hypothetical protein [Dysgonomonas sp. ZJ279]